MLIIRRSNCIIQHLVSSPPVGGRPVRRSLSWSLAREIQYYFEFDSDSFNRKSKTKLYVHFSQRFINAIL